MSSITFGTFGPNPPVVINLNGVLLIIQTQQEKEHYCSDGHYIPLGTADYTPNDHIGKH